MIVERTGGTEKSVNYESRARQLEFALEDVVDKQVFRKFARAYHEGKGGDLPSNYNFELKDYLRYLEDEEVRADTFSRMTTHELKKIRGLCDFPLTEAKDEELFYLTEPLRHYLSGQIDRVNSDALIPLDGIVSEKELNNTKLCNLNVLLRGIPEQPRQVRRLGDEDREELTQLLSDRSNYADLLAGRTDRQLRSIRANATISALETDDLSSFTDNLVIYIDAVLDVRAGKLQVK